MQIKLASRIEKSISPVELVFGTTLAVAKGRHILFLSVTAPHVTMPSERLSIEKWVAKESGFMIGTHGTGIFTDGRNRYFIK
jgi:hypothetical protein